MFGFQVKALDLDDSANGEIQYSIYANENIIVNDLFGVDAVTGAISLIDDSAPWGKIYFVIKFKYFTLFI